MTVPPKIAPFTFEESPYEIGQYASTMCAVSHGDFPLNITWKFNGNPIDKNSGILIAMNGKRMTTLAIDSLNHDHSGSFTCRGENLAGFAEYTAILEVNGMSARFVKAKQKNRANPLSNTLKSFLWFPFCFSSFSRGYLN